MSTIIPPTEKRCSRCKTVKPASAFDKSSSSSDGLNTYCKPCRWQWASTRKLEHLPEGYKRCTYCHEIKPFEQFFHDKNTRDGYGYECKPCHKERMNREVLLLESTAERRGSKKGMTFRQRPIEDLPEGHKRCLKCDEVKPADAFWKCPKRSDGLYSYCKACSKKRPRLPIILPESKQCTKCGEVKAVEEFYLNRGINSSGVSSWCKECTKVHALARGNRSYSYVKSRRRVLRDSYGMTIEEYEGMLQAQDGKCAACGHSETTIMRGRIVPLAVDHCRTTGAIRGLLCASCNRALGLLYDDPERVEGLLKYVKERVLY